jgi:uncharacterized protein YggL (DUF469 family)
MIYEKIIANNGLDYIQYTDESGLISWIPMDKGNADYQAYLQWLEAQDVAE